MRKTTPGLPLGDQALFHLEKVKMILIKKITLIVSGLILMLILAACGGGASSKDDLNPADNGSSQEQTTENDKQDDQSQGNTGNEEVAETVIFDDAGIKVIATGLNVDSSGAGVNLLIENNSGKTLMFRTYNESPSGHKKPSVHQTVADGEKANTELRFSKESMERYGINTFTDIQFDLSICGEAWNTYYDIDQIEFRISAGNSYIWIYDDSGTEVYNAGGIKIVFRGLDGMMMDWDLYGQVLAFYIENNTDQDISVDLGYVAINGSEGEYFEIIEGIPGEPVLAGEKDLVSFFVLNPDRTRSLSIEQIEKLEFSFHFYNMENGDEIVETDILSLTF